MDIKKLTEMGAFSPNNLIKKSITWTREVDGKDVEQSFFVHIRPFGVSSVERLQAAGLRDRSLTVQIIVEAVRLGDDGTEQMSYEQADTLHPNLFAALANAVNDAGVLEVLARGGAGNARKAAKKAAPRRRVKKPGTNSPSASAGEQSAS